MEEHLERAAVAHAARLPDRRHRQVGAPRVAGHQVADARPAGTQQAFAIRDAAHDLAGVLGVVRDEQPARVLLERAKRRDAVVVPWQNFRLAGRRLRRQQRLPGRQPMRAAANPVRDERRTSGVELLSEDVVRQPVDLDDQQALADPCGSRTFLCLAAQFEMNGARPAWSCCRRTSYASPSTWTISRPGRSVWIASFCLAASWRTRAPQWESSSEIERIVASR